MVTQTQICFDANQDEILALQNLAERKGVEVSAYLKEIISRHLQEKSTVDTRSDTSEKRAYKRKKVSILGVSCVKFSDGEMRSYPIVVEDISKGGIRISFRSVDNALMNKVALADHFEVVFTVPSTTHTVSFYCQRKRADLFDGLNMAGAFEDAHETCIQLISRMILGDRLGYDGVLEA